MYTDVCISGCLAKQLFERLDKERPRHGKEEVLRCCNIRLADDRKKGQWYELKLTLMELSQMSNSAVGRPCAQHAKQVKLV